MGHYFFLIFTYLRGRSHWNSSASNVAIFHFLKPETNKGDFRLYFELFEKSCRGRHHSEILKTNTKTLIYRMSHRYWDKFATQYLRLKSIYLSPDSNHMTHKTWRIDHYAVVEAQSSLEYFIEESKKFGVFLASCTRALWIHKRVQVAMILAKKSPSTVKSTRVRILVKIIKILKISKKNIKSLIFISKTDAGQFDRSHGSYDLNLDSEILILAGDNLY